MSKYIILIWTAISCAISVQAQSPKQWAKHGYDSKKEGDFYGAAYYYKKAFAADSTYLEMNWEMAEAYRQYNNYEAALNAYDNLVIQDGDEIYYLAVFYKAQMLKHMARYEEALEAFDIYLKLYKSRSVYHYKKAKQELESCQYAIDHQNDTSDLKVRHLEIPLNSFDGEVSPYLSADSILYFSSLRYVDTTSRKLNEEDSKRRFSIYKALADTDVVLLDSLFEKGESHLANVIPSPLRNRVYYSLCDNQGCQIYYRDSTENALGEPVEVKAISLSGYKATHPYPTKWDDKEVLIFTSDRPRGKGGMDLWYTEIKDGDRFGRPKNLGKTINTLDDEITPYYDTTDQKLYFSSTWHNGFGGFDIVSSEGSGTSWKEPENPGLPTNSSSNDLYYKQNDSLATGVFVSNRTGGFALKGENCCNDIYLIGIPTIDTVPTVDTTEITKPDSPTAPPTLASLGLLPLDLYFDNDQPEPRSYRETSRTDFAQLFGNYQKGLANYDQNQTDTALYNAFMHDEFNQSFEKLNTMADSIISRVQSGYRFVIGIQGHTSPLASEKYNLALAKRRIHSVSTYLKNYKGGIIANYIDSGFLSIQEIPVGELESSGLVSDNRLDKNQSVYSLKAMKARKVTIQWVDQREENDSSAVLQVSEPYRALKASLNSDFTFQLTNTGEIPLEIKSVETTSSNFSFDSIETIAPGETKSFIVHFKAMDNVKKELKESVTIHTNSYIPAFKLNFAIRP
tara:strand:- start:617 stop:2827 length:2211 start_codon:yes stop_codon:yes gene_type:complete